MSKLDQAIVGAKKRDQDRTRYGLGSRDYWYIRAYFLAIRGDAHPGPGHDTLTGFNEGWIDGEEDRRIWQGSE